MKNNRYFLITLVLLLALQAACVKKQDAVPPPVTDSRSLISILKNNFNFSMFYTALQRVGLDKTLEGKGPYTLMVPDNNAFAASGINADSLARIDTAKLRKLLLYHILPQSLPYKAMPQAIGVTFTTMAGLPVYFSQPVPAQNQTQQVGKGIVHINGVTVNAVDLAAGNGYILALSKVLYYPETSIKAYLETRPQYSYFVQALKQFGLLSQLEQPGPFVVMAPTNDLFMQNGIDETVLNGLDTLTYQKKLFNAYILYRQRFFLSDLLDAPISNALGANPGIITPEFVQIITPAQYGGTGGYGIWPLNFRYIQDISWIPPYGDPYIYAPAANFTNPDHQAANGIVHGIGGLVMLPDSARIHP
ncbi:hypothetical protein GCM10023149_07710 [Mucilaginibacter gynuensis]|uniref:FAS1 domain-containing protein n=1 Tax=Mucilaginibacter gynuensis TaxID=1302236 RepID=A0ABP8FWC0_9SPHI